MSLHRRLSISSSARSQSRIRGAHCRANGRGMDEILRRAARNTIEQLERRMLLTTIHGGDVFEFQDANGGTSGQIIRVKVAGNAGATIDLVGATLTPAPVGSADDLRDGVADGQFPILNDIPGSLNGNTNLFGSTG